jgi:hypothetical protein
MEKIMKSCELVLTISAIACTITECCDKEELPIIAAFFTQLGDTIATIIANNELTNTDQNNQDNKDNQDSQDNQNNSNNDEVVKQGIVSE